MTPADKSCKTDLVQCVVCDHDRFEGYSEARATNPYIADVVDNISVANLEVKTSFKCKKCKTLYPGKWKGRIVIPISQPFSPEVMQKTADEFIVGWNLRHAGKRCKSNESPAVYAGWRHAEQRSQTEQGKAPFRVSRTSVPVGAYLGTEEAWEYMTTLSNCG